MTASLSPTDQCAADDRFFASLTERRKYCLAALAAMGGVGTSPKNVAVKMVELGYRNESLSWAGSLGKTMHDLGVGAPGSPWASNNAGRSRQSNAGNPRMYGGPAMVFYDGDRSVSGQWSPFFLTVHGERWFTEHGHAYLGAPAVAVGDGGDVECPECGCVVRNMDAHREWHERIIDALGAK